MPPRSRDWQFGAAGARPAFALLLACLIGCGAAEVSPPSRASRNKDAGAGTEPDEHLGFVLPDAGKDDPGGPAAAGCGDGMVKAGEECDDGNTRGGDGCSSRCKLEPGFLCAKPGEPCAPAPRCGNGVVNDGETCDDGNTQANDGCSATCATEAGWSCPPGGICRAAHCGDGMKVGDEGCDDGNSASGDGCSATCLIESAGPTEADGWQCAAAGQPCTRTKCGDGVAQGSEGCDDGNNDMGDGCTPFCRREPVCPAAGGACKTVCGDGLLLPVDIAAGQECDDGNTVSHDGCSADCKLEPGYKCTTAAVMQDPLQLPIIYRDFKPFNETGGHPDFERFVGFGESGIVQSTLGPNGKPVHVAGTKMLTVNNDAAYAGVDYFASWFKDDPKYNLTIRDTLTFNRMPGGAYNYATTDFFPLDGRGFGNYMGSTDRRGQHRNFHFTSEVRYWFEYKGGERLDFEGDDDVWVFINKRLAVDLGGVHSALTGSVVLHATDGSAQVCDLINTCANRRTLPLGLELGKVYEIVVFQVERRTDQSSYQLSLTNFSGERTQCKSVCGDGIVTPDEACDAGPANQANAYGKGKCSATCTIAPYCGDGKVQKEFGETCDGGAGCNEMCKGRSVD
jgi:fibro-slime domain-containing protein